MKRYLLERYPTVWNTGIAWVLPAALVVHLFFFIIGFLSLTDKVMADGYYLPGMNFNSLTLLSFIASVLLLVLWLKHLFKNNAFQHFYPTKKRQLLGQFLAYFVIVMSCVSFYMSFVAGEHVKVISKYSDSYISAGLALRPIEEYYDSDYTIINNETVHYHTAYNADRIKNGDLFERYYMPSLGFAAFAYIVSLLIYSARVTGLRTTLLSVIFSGLLIAFLLILLLFLFSATELYQSEEAVLGSLLLCYFLVFWGARYLQGRVSKIISGILLNLSMYFFLPTLFFGVAFIFKVLDITSDDLVDDLTYFLYYFGVEHNTLFALLFFLLNVLVVLSVIVFMGLYAKVVKQWKALGN